MGKGYWIWIIPIGNNVISFGVVYDRQVIEQNLNCSGTIPNELIKSSSGFDKFIRQNKVISNLLENAEMLDFQSAGAALLST